MSRLCSKSLRRYVWAALGFAAERRLEFTPVFQDRDQAAHQALVASATAENLHTIVANAA